LAFLATWAPWLDLIVFSSQDDSMML